MAKSKREQAIEVIAEALRQSGVCPEPPGLELDDTNPEVDALATAIVEAMEIMFGKSKKGEKSDGAQVWDAYAEAYKKRYGFEPKRNATTNNQCAQLVSRLGLEDAKHVVTYYLQQTDAFYVRSMHQVGHCLKDSGSLYSRWKNGGGFTRRAADKIERTGSTIAASNDYLARKHGQNGVQK